MSDLPTPEPSDKVVSNPRKGDTKISYDWDFINYLESKFEKKVDSKMRKIREENKANEEALLKQLQDNKPDVSRETKKDFSLFAMLLLIIGGAFCIMGFKNGKTADKKE